MDFEESIKQANLALTNGDQDAALKIYQEIAQSDRRQSWAWLMAAKIILVHKRLPSVAIAYLKQTLFYDPLNGDAWMTLCEAYCQMDQLKEARAALNKAKDCGMSKNKDFYHEDGLLLLAEGKLDRAIVALKRAVRSNPNNPNAKWNLSLAKCRNGDITGGMNWFDSRFDAMPYLKYLKEIPIPMWKGESLEDKTLFVLAEQGYGDTFQMMRLFPLLKAKEIIFYIPESLVPLFNISHGWQPDCPYSVHATETGGIPKADLYCPVMSLPKCLNWQLNGKPYIHLNDFSYQENYGNMPKIGLVWAGNPNMWRDRYRSLTFEQVLKLAVPDAHVYSLQCGAAGSGLDISGASPLIRDLSSECQTWAHTAAIIDQLDLVIGICSAVIHLAGAMGKPAWLITPFVRDWRWGKVDSKQSLWYDSIRIFHQPKPGDWDSVLAEVAGEISNFSREYMSQEQQLMVAE